MHALFDAHVSDRKHLSSSRTFRNLSACAKTWTGLWTVDYGLWTMDCGLCPSFK